MIRSGAVIVISILASLFWNTLYTKVPYSVHLRFAALWIVGLELGLVVGLGSVLVLFFAFFWFWMYV